MELFQASWQYFALTFRLQGVDGVLQIIRQMQRLELPASTWDREVMWGRLSPHLAHAGSRRVRPRRLAPVAVFLREDAYLLMPAEASKEFNVELLSHPAREVIVALEQHGERFFQTRIWPPGK